MPISCYYISVLDICNVAIFIEAFNYYYHCLFFPGLGVHISSFFSKRL